MNGVTEGIDRGVRLFAIRPHDLVLAGRCDDMLERGVLQPLGGCGLEHMIEHSPYGVLAFDSELKLAAGLFGCGHPEELDH